jgi:hypothetical protein
MIMKKRGNKVFLTQSPTIEKNRAPTPGQEEHRKKFTAATSYASAAMGNPELEKLYLSQSYHRAIKYNYAVRDYLKPPYTRNTCDWVSWDTLW